MNNIIKRKWNQNSMVIIEDLQGMAFQAESGGHTFQISGIDGEGNAVALSGTPAGVMLRSDGQDVTLTCSVSEGVVSATLPANAYVVPGRFGLTIFLTSDGQKTAIYAAVGTVGKTSSGTVAPPAGSDVVTLVNQINTAIAAIPASYNSCFAPAYSTSGLYSVGQYVTYDGKLYRCNTAITTAETWTAAHWTQTNLGADVYDLKSALKPVVYVDNDWRNGTIFNASNANFIATANIIATNGASKVQVLPGIGLEANQRYCVRIATFSVASGETQTNSSYRIRDDVESITDQNHVEFELGTNELGFAVMISKLDNTDAYVAVRVANVDTGKITISMINNWDEINRVVELVSDGEMSDDMSNSGKGGYYNASGEFKSNNAYQWQDYRYLGGRVFTEYSGTRSDCSYVFYNASHTYISGKGWQLQSEITNIPEGTAFIRISTKTNATFRIRQVPAFFDDIVSSFNTVGYIECDAPICYVDTANSTFEIQKSTHYCAVRYGAGQKVVLNSDVSAITGSFNSLQYLIYDLSDNTFKLANAGGNHDYNGYKNKNMIFLGYMFGSKIMMNCVPGYYLNGTLITTTDRNFDTLSTAGEMLVWTTAKIYVDTTANTLTITPGYVSIRYGNNIVGRITVSEEDLVITGSFSSLQDLFYNSKAGTLVFQNTGANPDAYLNPDMINLGHFYGSDVCLNCFPGYYLNGAWINKKDHVDKGANRQLKLAFVGDSVSTYAGISPAWNGDGYYPRGDISSSSEVYSYIAAADIGATVACLQAVSQSTIQYQVNDNRNWYGWADDWVANVKATNPDVIIINLGVNDCFGQITGSLHYYKTLAGFDDVKRTDIYGAYQYMIMKYQTECPDAIIVCVIPTFSYSSSSANYTPENFNKVCDLIADCARYHGCQLVDFRKTGISYINMSDYKLTGDTIHPNKAGMALMGHYLGARLNEIAGELNL